MARIRPMGFKCGWCDAPAVVVVPGYMGSPAPAQSRLCACAEHEEKVKPLIDRIEEAG